MYKIVVFTACWGFALVVLTGGARQLSQHSRLQDVGVTVDAEVVRVENETAVIAFEIESETFEIRSPQSALNRHKRWRGGPGSTFPVWINPMDHADHYRLDQSESLKTKGILGIIVAFVLMVVPFFVKRPN